MKSAVCDGSLGSVVGRDTAVGIATPYGLDGPGIESRWGWDFLYVFRPALRPTQPFHGGYRVSFLGVKRPGRGGDHQPPAAPLCLRGLFLGEFYFIVN
jgi:hypothetical protein